MCYRLRCCFYFDLLQKLHSSQVRLIYNSKLLVIILRSRDCKTGIYYVKPESTKREQMAINFYLHAVDTLF